MSLKIGIIVGTTRPTRVGRQVAEWFLSQVKDTPDVELQLIDLAEVNLPFLSEPNLPSQGNYAQASTKQWAKTIGVLDGFVWVVAEYNHGYPAPLKNAVDTIYKEWENKPVAFVGYGGYGAARSIEHLVPVAAQINMVPLPSVTVGIIDVWNALNDSGHPQADFVRGRPDRLMTKLTWWAKLLQTARAQTTT